MLLLISTFAGVGGQLFLKKATMDPAFTFDGHHPMRALFGLATNPYVLGWMAFAAISAVLWVKVVQNIELSFAFPIMMSLTIISILVLSYFLFGEQISLLRWFGIALMIVGIFLASK
jgi:multidrug transporter EmrE-like cation transporter